MSEERRVTASRHSIERNSKRFHTHGRGRSESELRESVRFGRTVGAFSGRERRWLLSRMEAGFSYYVYKRRLVVVADREQVCVTTYELPDWFNNSPTHHGKESIRSFRAYRRLMAEEENTAA